MSLPLTGYLAADGFEEELATELGILHGAVKEIYGRLMITEGTPRPSAWALNVWRNPHYLTIQSIKDGAAQLRGMQRNWALYDFHLHRRAQLIQDNLPHVSLKPIAFLAPLPTAPLGSWTLIDENTILASADCSSPFRNGELEFIEDKANPPNRAYLKLWDFLTVRGVYPQPHELCLDLGASPGGWSWVLANLGCRVISIDKSPLAPEIEAMPNIEYRAGSAFAIEPEKHEPVDWLFSDVICYPDRLMTMVKRWMDSGKAKNLVCTLKFQGETDHNAVAAFAAMEGSEVRHLYHNKHELTWCRLAPKLAKK